MENKPEAPQAAVPVQPVVTPTPPPATPSPVVVEPRMGTQPISPTPAVAPSGAKKLPPIKLDPKELIAKFKIIPKKFKILGGLFLFMLFLLIIASFTKQGKQVKNLILPTGTPIPVTTPVGEVFVPSPYANDPEVLDIEKRVSDFDARLRNTELREDNLRIPTLDWEIDFKLK